MKKSHVKPDHALKTFWRDNERFADLFNAVLFNGQSIIDPSSLSVEDTDLSSLFINKSYSETIQRVFDVTKKSVNGINFILLALENQQQIHYAMPLRNMLNDALLYYKECAEIERKNIKNNSFSSSAEFLSKFSKHDRLHPVFTICVYYGEKIWDGPVSLKEMMDIPPYMESLVADYKMHLVQIHNSQYLPFHHPDVQTVFDICRLFQNNEIKSISDVYKSYPLTPELGTVIGTVVGSQRMINYAINTNTNERGVPVMWKSVEEMEKNLIKDAEARGEAQGQKAGLLKGIRIVINTCKTFNLTQESVVDTLTNEFQISRDEASGYVHRYW